MLPVYVEALKSGEDFMLKRVIEYAGEAEYSRYTSAKEEDWRMTVRQPAQALIRYLESHDTPDPIHVDEAFDENPAAAFGVIEAERHREHGVRFDMFLGSRKLVRQAFVDLIHETEMPQDETERSLAVTRRFWDKFELGFSSEWMGAQESMGLTELQDANRRMTNEKERYLALFKSIAQPAFVVDTKMRITEVNPAFETFVGASKEQVQGKPCRSFIRCATGPECPLEEAIRTGSNFSGAEARVRVDGADKTVLFSGSVLDDASGKFAGGVGILQDITERKKAEEALRKGEARLAESNQLLAGVLEHTHMMAAFLDPRFDFIWANRAYADACRHDPSFFPGKNHFDLYPHEENLAIFQRVVDSGEPFFVAAKPFEYPDQPERGVTYWDWSLIPVKDSAGKVTGLVFTLAEVTERIRAEEAQRLHAAIYENVAEGIYLVGLDDGVIKSANPSFERMFGYDVGEMVGKSVAIVNAPSDKTPEETKTEIIDILRETGEWHGEIENIKMDGTRFWCYANVSLFDHPEYGRVAVSIHTDISERKRAKVMLRESENRHREMFANISSGVAVYEAVDDGDDFVFIDFNPAAEKIEEVDRKDVIGKRVTEAFPSVEEFGLLDVLHRVWRTGEAERYPVSLYEDGRIAGWRENYVHRLPSGEIVAIYDDVTVEKQAEEKIRLMSSVVEQSTEGMAVADLDGNLTFVNQAWAAMHGYGSPDDLLGRNLRVFHTPEQMRRDVEPFNRKVMEEGHHAGEVGHARRDGATSPTSMVTTLLRDAKGHPVALSAVARNITRRKKSESRLRLTSEALEALNQSDEKVDTIRQILELIQKHTGIEAVAIRMKEGDDYPYYETSGFPEDFVEAESHLCERDKNGEITRGANCESLFECMCGNVIRGRFDPALPFFTKGGAFWSNSATELLASTTDEDRQARTRSRCNCEGYESVALIPLRFGDRIIGLLQLNDTRKGMFSLADIHFFEKLGDSIGVAFGRRQAQEERLRLERQMLHAQKLESLGVMAGGIAHDFNNLLMAILGNADMALQDLGTYHPAQSSVKEIETAARRAAGLTKQMLAYSGKGSFVVEPVDLSAMVEEMTRLLEISITKKAVLKLDFAENLPTFEADATQVRQVILNLITTASEAMADDGGAIALSTGVADCDRAFLDTDNPAYQTGLDEPLPEGRYVFVKVADTGSGMDAEALAKVFDPFFTTKFTGRGLGMAAVLGIVRGHRGAIKIQSEEGQGTTFTVHFPAGEASATETGGLPEAEAAGRDQWQGSGTVLMVDDEEPVLTLGRRMLERLGFTVLTAAGGREALDIFEQRADEVVCVVLDWTMPRLDGEQVFGELRRIRPDIKVILSSGHEREEATGAFAKESLAGFMHKPYQLAELRTELKRVLGP